MASLFAQEIQRLEELAPNYAIINFPKELGVVYNATVGAYEFKDKNRITHQMQCSHHHALFSGQNDDDVTGYFDSTSTCVQAGRTLSVLLQRRDVDGAIVVEQGAKSVDFVGTPENAERFVRDHTPRAAVDCESP